MEYIENFYHALKKAIQEARVNVVLYVPELTTNQLCAKEGRFFRKKSLLTELKDFIFRENTLLEYTGSPREFFPIETFQPLEYQIVLESLTDKQFVKPLEGFAESFAIIDGEDVLFMPYAQRGIPIAFQQKKSLIAARFFQQIYSQIVRHERSYKTGQSDNTFLNLTPTKEIEKIVKAVTDEMKKYVSSSQHKFNPFITKIINKNEEEN